MQASAKIDAVTLLQPDRWETEMRLAYEWSDDDQMYFVVNRADFDPALNAVSGQPDVLQEIRRATVEILLNRARNGGDTVVKVTSNRPVYATIKGYVTFLSQIAGSDLSGLERKLGFKTGMLAQGAYIYALDSSALHGDNVAPRGSTSWSAGVTPRELDNLSKTAGAPVGYHNDYPPALDPIIQFAVLEPVPYVGAPRFLGSSDTV